VTRVELPYSTIDGLTDINTAIAVNILLVSSDAQFNHILGPKIQSRLKGVNSFSSHTVIHTYISEM
jgi:hypothetical protein